MLGKVTPFVLASCLATVGFGAVSVSNGVSLSLSAGDAGRVWRASMPGGTVLRGDVLILSAKDFSPVGDAAMRARFPEEARARVRVADLSARLKETVPEPPNTFMGATRRESRYMLHIVKEPMGAFLRPLLFVNGKWMNCARWPNRGFARFTETRERGVGVFSKDAKGKKPCAGSFVVAGEHPRRWVGRSGFLVNGYLCYDWDNAYTKVASVALDGTNTLIRLAAPQHFDLGNRPPRRFAVLDLPEELDCPGEWWFDRATKKVYAIPPAGAEFAAGDEIVLAFGDRPILQGDGVRDLRFENLVFECAGGDIARFSHATNVVFESCVFRNAGGIGLVIEGVSNVVRNCRFEGLGGQGVNLQGGDRVHLVGSGNVVENCRFRDFGKLVRAYAPGVYLDGCGATVRKCVFRDAPHSAILFGGNDHVIEYCDISRVLQETADAGTVYSGRDWTGQGNVLRWNYIHDIPPPQDMFGCTIGFYFDDGECGDAVYGNVFEGLHRGVFIGGGRDHPVKGNVFLNCSIGVAMDERVRTWKGLGKHLAESAEKSFRFREEPWSSRYPNLARIHDDRPSAPRHNPIEGNLFWKCGRRPLSHSLEKAFQSDIVFTNNVEVPKGSTERLEGHPFLKTLPEDHPYICPLSASDGVGGGSCKELVLVDEMTPCARAREPATSRTPRATASQNLRRRLANRLQRKSS